MPIRALIHVHNDETILCEVDSLPKPTDNFVMLYNPRRRDGKAIATMADGATSFAFPWSRIAFIEFFEEVQQRENVVGFFRETDAQRRHS